MNKSSLGQVVIAEFDDYNDKSQVLNNPDLEWPFPCANKKYFSSSRLRMFKNNNYPLANNLVTKYDLHNVLPRLSQITGSRGYTFHCRFSTIKKGIQNTGLLECRPKSYNGTKTVLNEQILLDDWWFLK